MKMLSLQKKFYFQNDENLIEKEEILLKILILLIWKQFLEVEKRQHCLQNYSSWKEKCHLKMVLEFWFYPIPIQLLTK